MANLTKKIVFTAWLVIILTFLGLAMIISIYLPPTPVSAAASTPALLPPGPDRFTSIMVDTNIFDWWMAAWRDSTVFCSFYIDYPGLPSDSDIISACGQDLYEDWKTYSTPCLENDTTQCPGYYFVQVSRKTEQREITLKLPPAAVKVSLEGCEPDPTGWCTQQPTLVLTGSDPLPNESIIGISGIAGSDPFSCSGERCTFLLSETNPKGLRLTFWAFSSYGDSSPIFDAFMRVKMDGGTTDRLTSRWFVDVISSQWTGAPAASCTAAWEAFPPTDGLPQWLTTPKSSAELKSSIPYSYLAANLIKQGVTNAKSCPDNGLNLDGSANACGIKAANRNVVQWQNRFDKLIFDVAQKGDVPAQLLKNLFSRESQFWPGVFKNGKDVGLGQMTEGGADTALLWNSSFYDQFCPLVLNKSVCENAGFSKLKPSEQKILRGALVGSVDARCDDCPLGLDLSRADFSVGVFAHTLLANCEQAGKIVQNVTGKMPGQTVDYETLWRFTLVNYNAGSGCLSEALTQAYSPSDSDPLGWSRVSPVLEQFCPGAASYVEDVSKNTQSTP